MQVHAVSHILGRWKSYETSLCAVINQASFNFMTCLTRYHCLTTTFITVSFSTKSWLVRNTKVEIKLKMTPSKATLHPRWPQMLRINPAWPIHGSIIYAISNIKAYLIKTISLISSCFERTQIDHQDNNNVVNMCYLSNSLSFTICLRKTNLLDNVLTQPCVIYARSSSKWTLHSKLQYNE